MNAINNVDQALTNSIGGAQVLAGNNKSDEGSVANTVTDVVYLASKVGPRKIASTYDTVKFSQLIPKPIEAKKLEDADSLAGKLSEGSEVTLKDERDVREDRVFAALVGMRLMQQSSGEAKEVWLGGLASPTDEEIAAAYRRLTQRVGQPNEVENPEYIHNMRVDLLDYFRNYPQQGGNNLQTKQEQLENNAA